MCGGKVECDGVMAGAGESDGGGTGDDGDGGQGHGGIASDELNRRG